jgi:hypothetical protein
MFDEARQLTGSKEVAGKLLLLLTLTNYGYRGGLPDAKQTLCNHERGVIHHGLGI